MYTNNYLNYGIKNIHSIKLLKQLHSFQNTFETENSLSKYNAVL